ncbi:restriction endonuclease subunit S [Micromonospora sp. SL4-19]|uniref:restriction endonuclease subunit S n=1 Tax=Micromonospora sp. SL4-19 TaxID=3399129 RepID=UPI003A4E2A31
MSLLGVTPGGWVESALGELADIRSGPSGAAISAEDRRPDGHPMIAPKDLADGRVRSNDVYRIHPDVAAGLSRYLVSPGDVLVTRAGTVGRAAWIPQECDGWLYSTGLVRVRPQGVAARYLAYYLALPEVQDWLKRHARGTAVPSISAAALGELPVLIPPPERQADIVHHLGLLDEQAEVHAEISRVAARTRDGLAWSLLRGEKLQLPR